VLPGNLRPHFKGQTIRDTVQPTADRIGKAQGRRLSAEDKEGCLENILGDMRIVQDAPTCAQDHRAMPPHQDRERLLVALGRETPNQFPIRWGMGPRGRGQSTEMIYEELCRFTRHDQTSTEGRWLASSYTARIGGRRRLIFLPKVQQDRQNNRENAKNPPSRVASAILFVSVHAYN
jgi:hypothetical protein